MRRPYQQSMVTILITLLSATALADSSFEPIESTFNSLSRSQQEKLLKKLLTKFTSTGEAPSPQPQYDQLRTQYEGMSDEAVVEAAEALIDKYDGRPENLREASTILDMVIQRSPDHAQARLQRARLDLTADNWRPRSPVWRQAKHALQELVEQHPEHADTYSLLGFMETQEGRYREAEELLRKAQSLGCQNPWLPVNLARLYMKTGRRAQAYELYDQVIANPPADNPKILDAAYRERARPWREQGDLEKLDEMHRDLIRHQPGKAWPLGNYASFLVFTKGDYDAGIVRAREALAIMNYGMARVVLAAGYYGKWSEVRGIPGSEDEAGRYLYEAARVMPADEILTDTAQHLTTLDLHLALLTLPVNVDTRDKDGDTSLCLAVGQNNHRAVHALLERGADANGRCDRGNTPLLLDVKFNGNDREIFDALLAAGADVSMRDGSNNTPQVYARRKRLTEKASALKDAGRK
ncbi:MAG: tetratricopeptide repeat protein [Gammaproteobacteria bacterium]|nr:tetratricopeptide repeat protein [Gammaproteobacteria bacterium]